MAQTGYTPISIYYSATASNTPTASNLVSGELAINTADGKLFYKDSAGVVQTIATKTAATLSVPVVVSQGGTGLTSLTAGYIPYGNGTSAFSSNAGLYYDGTNLQVGTNTAGYGTLNVQKATVPYTTITLGDQATPANGVGIYLRCNGTAPAGISTAGSPLAFYLGAGTAEAVRINQNANLILQGGTTTASGVGVTFPATQSASSDANCLDDYEKGTFTPTLNGFTSSGITSNTGTYTKIGRFVYINIQVISTSFSGVGGGTSYFTGLPFAPSLGNQCNFSLANANTIANQNSGSNLAVGGGGSLYTSTFAATSYFVIAGTYQI